MNNNSLLNARKNRNDEFYTRLQDIEIELYHYRNKFKNKIIYCNCDNLNSNFFEYFKKHFYELNIKGVLITGIDNTGYYYDGKIKNLNLKTNGHFEELDYLLDYVDVVVTNPPFSLFKEFIDLIMKYNKSFIVIGSNMAITYKSIFPLIREQKIFLGYSKPKKFINSDKNVFTYWYTSYETIKPKLELVQEYNSDDYPKYDNFNAIEVSKVKNIPKDYEGIMGVPVTFVDKWNKNQFEIIGFSHGVLGRQIGIREDITHRTRLQIKKNNGYKLLFPRILIKRKDEIDSLVE